MQYIPSGVYFARAKVNGKAIRASLGSNRIWIAKLRLPDKIKELRKPPAEVGTFADGRMKYESETKTDHTLAPLSKTYRLRCVDCLLKTWPGATPEQKADAAKWEAEIAKRRYAIIVDEAHSSQSGETSRELKAILGTAAQPENSEDELDWEDRLNQVMQSRGR